MNTKEIMSEALRTGTIWLGGEMEFPANEGPRVAFNQAVKIAEACGYLVNWHFGQSALKVQGGDICGFVVCDWFHADTKQIVKVEYWSCEASYRDDFKALPTAAASA